MYIVDLARGEHTVGALRSDGAVITWGKAQAGGAAQCVSAASTICLGDDNGNGIATPLGCIRGLMSWLIGQNIDIQAAMPNRSTFFQN